GLVAASGGYWLSMYGDTILAAPNTITGSIGVIGGWVYNKGLKEKLGVTTDYVKTGEHAELGFGATVPFIGVSLPDRNLTKEERTRMEYIIKDQYRLFTGKVADGRKLSREYIDSIGQGRVWTGTAGLSNKLIDVSGGMREAIELAKKMAGLKNDDDIRILQYPEMPVFNLSFLQPKIFGIGTGENQTISDIKFRIEHNGQALFMLPSDYLDLTK
ncbi:MAG: S49 family peptidase, partial [Syntrophothermus sp.]